MTCTCNPNLLDDEGPFAELLRDQHLEEREEYIQDLTDAIVSKSRELRLPEGMASIKSIMLAIGEIDPMKHTRIREEYIRTGFKDSFPKSSGKKKILMKDCEDLEIAIESFLSNLTMGVVKTHTNKDELAAKLTLAAEE